jgi:xylulokinase
MNHEDLLLGLDIGTTGVKGCLVTGRGEVVAEAYSEHACRYPQPNWVEHDMLENWWQNPAQVVRKLLQTEGVQPAQVKAVCASGLHPNFGPADAQGNPLCGAILYSDNRAVAELEEINTRHSLKLTSEELTPKLVWFLRHRPEARRMAMFFDAVHYFVYRLTGEYITDTISVGAWGAIYHAPTTSWKPEVCVLYGIPLTCLPRVLPPIQIAGEISRLAAAATGLLPGTPVLAGTNDVTASTIAAGVLHCSEAAANYGTAGLLPVMKMDMLEALRFPYPGVERGQAPQEGYLFDYPAYCLTTGDSLRWFRDEFGQVEHLQEQQGGPSAYARFDALAASVPPGCEGLIFLPYMLGQRSPEFNPHATAGFFGLRRNHTRAHIYRALLEAWGFTIRYGLECYYPQGHPLQRLVATGGGARSPLWRQIVSDITGIPQDYAPEAEGARADAYLAGMALGWFPGFDALLHEWITQAEPTQPDPAVHQYYSEEVYPNYVAIHQMLKSSPRGLNG